MKNYYEILEVNPKASDEIIKKVYKIKVKQNHPDLFQGDEKTKAEEITKELTEAYNILSDSEKRKNYDLELEQNDDKTDELEQYKNIIISLKEENEYLKNVILSKDNTINTYLNNMNLNNYTNYNNNENYNNINKANYNEEYIPHNAKEVFNNIKKAHNNAGNFNSREYFNSILFDLKQLGFKLGILLLFVISILLIFWGITGNNIFKSIF